MHRVENKTNPLQEILELLRMFWTQPNAILEATFLHVHSEC